jgi:hypothetical protein
LSTILVIKSSQAIGILAPLVPLLLALDGWILNRRTERSETMELPLIWCPLMLVLPLLLIAATLAALLVSIMIRAA